MTEPVLAAAIAPLAILAKWLKLPYPIVFVIGGALIAFVPGLPHVAIAPDWIFYTVLPPLLFHGGWVTDWTLLRRNLRPIALLAVGLVVASTVAVAVMTEWLAPGSAGPARSCSARSSRRPTRSRPERCSSASASRGASSPSLTARAYSTTARRW